MANAYDVFSSSSDSHPSSPPGDKVKDANETEQFQETELFEDTLVIKSPFTENLNLNTEVMEDSEPVENMTSGAICEYEQEVVLDSEDEEMGAVTDAKGIKLPLLLFQKRCSKLPCEQADLNATTFWKSATGNKRVSTDAKSFYDNDHPYLPARLNHIHSPEPGDSTQAALGFVDWYLSSNNEDLFQGIQHRNVAWEKSPHVSSARGPLSLAKKIKARTQKEEKEPFKWVVSDQSDIGAGIFCKKIESPSNCMRRIQKNSDHFQNQGNYSAGNRCGEKLVQGLGLPTETNNSIKELDVQSSATRENVNACSGVVHAEEYMPDIGLDTQIAAEAMEALAYVPDPGCHINNACQPENTANFFLSDLTENESHLKYSACRQNPDLQSVTTKLKKRNASSCSFSTVTCSSSWKLTDNEESNPASRKMKKIIKSKSTIGGQFENNTSLPICGEHVSLEQDCSRGEYLSFQTASEETKNLNESRWARIKDQPSLHTGKNNNVKEKGITIRQKRNENGLVDDPLKLDVRTKCPKLSTNSCGVARKSRLNHQVQVSPQLSATSSSLTIDSWIYPKRSRGKRKWANVQTHLNAPSILCIDRKESNVHSTRSPESQDDIGKSSFPHTHPHCEALHIDNGRYLLQGNSVHQGSADDAVTFEKLHNMHPLLLAHVGPSSRKSVTKSSSEGTGISNANHPYNEHDKKPCDKNLPKASLLKELIRLGVSNYTSDLIWKDLRQRRDMAYVRVLFSQHLDHSVVKQLKKILARLNISFASSSMEATHFVADKFTRTKNMLETMALGKLVVTHLWLESCGHANCFIDEKNYILRDVKKEKEIGFSMPVSLARARQKPLLKGKRIYITPHVKPDKQVVTSLVTAVHGQVVDESQIYADNNDDLLILSCEEDYASCHHFLTRGIAVYSSELLLNGIVIQKLEVERHQLFKNQVSRSNLSMSNLFGMVYKRRLRPVCGQ